MVTFYHICISNENHSHKDIKKLLGKNFLWQKKHCYRGTKKLKMLNGIVPMS